MNTKWKRVLLVSGCLNLTALSALAQSGVATLSPAAGTYIRAGSYADTNFSTDSELYAKTSTSTDVNRISYFSFDLSSVARASGVTSATLSFYAHNGDGTASVPVGVYGLTDNSWNAGTMTWNTGSPNHAATQSAAVSPTSDGTATLLATSNINNTNQYYSYDVTDFVNNQITEAVIGAIPGATASFMALDTAVSNMNVVIQGSASATPPKLVVSYNTTTQTLSAVADSYINAASPTTNYGTATAVKVKASYGSGEMGYLKFDLSNIAAPFVGQAVLRLYAATPTGTVSPIHAIYSTDYNTVSPSWAENAINWTNAPNHYLDPASYYVSDSSTGATTMVPAFSISTMDAHTFKSFDVSNAMNTQLAGGSSGAFTFAIVADPTLTSSFNVNFSATGTTSPMLVMTRSADGAVLSFSPLAHNYVQNGTSSTVSNGTAAEVSVSNAGAGVGRISYLTFKASTITASAGINPVTSATLYLYPTGVAVGGNLMDIYRVSEAWGANSSLVSTASWATAANASTPMLHDSDPSSYAVADTPHVRAGTLLDKITVPASTTLSGQYYDIPVTTQINNQLFNGVATAGFLVSSRDLASGSEVLYSSREGTNPPELIITPTSLANNLREVSDTVVDSNALNYAFGFYGTQPNQNTVAQAPVLSYNGYQYAAYYNGNRQLCVARRALASGGWTVAAFTDFNFTSNDTHNIVSMRFCPLDGTIHLSFGMHAIPLLYRCSQTGVLTSPPATWDTSLFNPIQNYLTTPGTPGFTQVTYPRFVTEPSGKMLLHVRSGVSGDGDNYLFEYDGNTGVWSTVGQIDSHIGTYTYSTGTATTSSPFRSAYVDGLVYDGASPARLHTSWTWREGKGALNHDIMYAYSPDNGRSWYNSSETCVATTSSAVMSLSTPVQIEAEDVRTNLDNNGAISVDSTGRVHVIESLNDPQSPLDSTIEQVRHYIHYWRAPSSHVWTTVDLGFFGTRPKLLTSGSAAYLIFTSSFNKICIAKATSANSYNDWQVIQTAGAGTQAYTGDMQVDYQRWADANIISILAQEVAPSVGAPSNLHVIEFKAN